MEENNIILKDLIDSYDNLSVSDKRKELGREIAELSIVIQKLLSDLDNDLTINEDFLEGFNNLYDGKSSESEYLTGLYEDILNVKELLGTYFNNTIANEYIDQE